MQSETRKELWGIIQAFCAVYCCVIGTWALVRPPQAPVSTAGGAPVTPTAHLVWWFWLLIGGFFLCAVTLAVGTVANIVSRKKARKSSSDSAVGGERTVDEIISNLPKHAEDGSTRLREHLKDAEQRADRLLQESKQLGEEKAALQKKNQDLQGQVSELGQRWNNSALLSGQFLQEAATLSGDLILVWLREHCPTKTQFSSVSMAENLGISREAAQHGLELLQREYGLVTRPLQNVDGWEYIPSLTSLHPTLKATTRFQQAATKEEIVRIVSICLVRFRVDEPTISRGKTLKIRYEIDASEDISDNIWLGASIPYDQGKKFIAEKKQDKRISIYAGIREYDRDLTIPPDAPLGNHKLQANVWQRDKIIARGTRIDIVIVA
jgi:hypothetical protein